MDRRSVAALVVAAFVGGAVAGISLKQKYDEYVEEREKAREEAAKKRAELAVKVQRGALVAVAIAATSYAGYVATKDYVASLRS